MFRKDPDEVYRDPAFDRFPWLEHGFGTRHTKAWPGDREIASLRQVHSAVVIVANGETGCLGEADALIADRPGPLLSVRTADCLPVLLVDERLRAVAAIHAGWRGIVAGVVGAAVDALGRRFGSRPADVYAAIGPGIGACCFQVGPEVAIRFQELFPERNDLDHGTRLDLPESVRRQLIAAGLDPRRISTSALCTRCRPEEFHSWRRDPGEAERMVSAIGWKSRQ